jgi:hypothetical protein
MIRAVVVAGVRRQWLAFPDLRFLIGTNIRFFGTVRVPSACRWPGARIESAIWCVDQTVSGRFRSIRAV